MNEGLLSTTTTNSTGTEWTDESLVPLISYMCTKRAVATTEARIKSAEHDCARRGAHLVEGFIREEQCDLKTAILSLFHNKCIAHHLAPSLGHSGCQMDKHAEKAILKRWQILRRQSLFEEDLIYMDRTSSLDLMQLELSLIERLFAEARKLISKRNELAYNIMRRYFASSLIKCLELGKEALGPGQRLLCDYNSVEQLALCKDTDSLFELAARWLHHVDNAPRRATACYKCHRKRPPKSPAHGAGFDCQQCGKAWFCSIQCQLDDESSNVFAHMHECDFQQRRRRRQREGK